MQKRGNAVILAFPLLWKVVLEWIPLRGAQGGEEVQKSI